MDQSERDSVLHTWGVPSRWQAPDIVGGQGAWLHLADGGRLLDMSSLAECSHLGHQHPKVVAAIQRQAAELCFVTNGWGSPPRRALAEALLEKAGFEGGRVFFTLGGADANEHAVKIARLARGLPQGLVITRERSYHGASYACMALSGDARTEAQVDPAAHGVLHVPAPYAYRCPFGATDAPGCGERAAMAVAAQIRSHGADTVAAVLMEPNAGTNGIVAPDNYWPLLRRFTREAGVPLIADEVMSGFGRCGEWFAWQRHGDAGRPDLVTLAKGLTGAHLPLGAVLVSAEIYAAIQDLPLMSGLTYAGHPLCCAAGLAAVHAYEEEGLVARSRRLGAEMFTRLRALPSRHALVGDVRGGHGLFAVLELVSDRATRAPLAPWPQVAPSLQALVARARAEGVSFAVRGNLVILAPPLVIEENELWRALDLLDRLLGEMEPT